ncbi:unnamed protein product [Rotaria sp. Silwood2]|nr:unnamed protein product [Rotaria sp. Silwood2]
MVEPSTDFYSACRIGDISMVKRLLKTLPISEINRKTNGSTPLHVACYRGHTDIVRLLLQLDGIDISTKNDYECVAYEEAANNEIKWLFEELYYSNETVNSLFGIMDKIEWFDAYQNAYRIASENHKYMRRWLTKIPLKTLLIEIDEGYINILGLKKPDYEKIKNQMRQAIDYNDPIPLIRVYTSSQKFSLRLNKDLAKLGSDFRFRNTESYRDNEPPKSLGQYLFATIFINHPKFEEFQHSGVTYRGMTIKQNDFEQYSSGSWMMTRSFLSTSKCREVASVYATGYSRQSFRDGHRLALPVICIYHTKNPRSSLDVSKESLYPDEKEVLIIPFVVFKVRSIREKIDDEITEIDLEEYDFAETS